MSRKNRQRVEPAAGLIKTFGNKVRREMLFKILFVFKRIMILRIRHRARLKPAVEHLWNAVHSTAAFFARNRNLIYKLLVQVVRIYAAQIFKFLTRTDTQSMLAVRIITTPDRNRVTPVAVTAYSPVARTGKPFSKAAFLDMSRLPFYLAVCL